MSKKCQWIRWLIFLLGKGLGKEQLKMHPPMAGIMSSESNRFQLKSLEQVKCSFQMVNILHLWKMEAIKNHSIGQMRVKDGLNLLNQLLLYFGNWLEQTINWEHYMSWSICLGIGLSKSAICKQELFASGDLRKLDVTLDFQRKMNIIQWGVY